MKEEYDEEFLNYLKENDPSMYDEFNTEKRINNNEVKNNSFGFSGSKTINHGFHTHTHSHKMEFSIGTEDGINIKTDGKNAKTSLYWFGFIALCFILSGLSFLLGLILRSLSPIFCTLSFLFPSIIILAYPIYAIKIGRIISFERNSTGITQYKPGAPCYKEESPGMFWLNALAIFFVGLLMVGGSLLFLLLL